MQTSTAGASVSLYRRIAGSAAIDDRQLIADAVAAFTGAKTSDVVVTMHCRRCGADDHGKPRIVAPMYSDGSEIQVSLSRAGTRNPTGARGEGSSTVAGGLGEASSTGAGRQVAVAVSWGSPIGFDIEDPAAVAAATETAPLDEAALHPDERAALAALPESERDRRRTLLWTAKEAVLKATGWGLAIDPSSLSLSILADDELTLDTWPAELGLDEAPAIVVVDLPQTDAGSRLLGAIAVLGPAPVIVHPVD